MFSVQGFCTSPVSLLHGPVKEKGSKVVTYCSAIILNGPYISRSLRIDRLSLLSFAISRTLVLRQLQPKANHWEICEWPVSVSFR